MRDGTVLRADVYRPDAPGAFPILLCRTPYDKSHPRQVETGRRLAERGYVVVLQDVRGRHASDGDFLPGFYSADHRDAEDGYDTVEWAAGLPGSDGQVGTFGASYDGWVQWELATTRPPHLVCMLAGGIAANLLDRELGGVLRLGRVLDWTVNNLSVDAARRPERPLEGSRPPTRRRACGSSATAASGCGTCPSTTSPRRPCPACAATGAAGWTTTRPTTSASRSVTHEVDVPVLSTVGWYDQQIGTIQQFTGMRANGRTERARAGQRLIIGPCTHTLVDLDRRVGDVDFGPQAERSYFDIADEWFGHWLKGDGPGEPDRPPVELFVMGANRWRSEDDWPLARARETEYFLRSDGHADMRAGAGRLSREAPRQEPADEYVYDPRDPLMTLYTPAGQHAPLDQRALDGRPDVMVYQTPPLEREVEVTGPVEVVLWAASSAPDTDFVAKLIDVWPDGFAQELCHGILRCRYRDSLDQPSPLEPERPYELRIRVNPTGNLFRLGAPHPPGHQQQRLPQLRPQPQHRGRRLPGGGSADGAPADLPRRRPGLAAGAAGDSGVRSSAPRAGRRPGISSGPTGYLR